MTTSVQIVDDHFLFAEALASVIKELREYELVGISVTGPQAISTAQEKQPDVILLDYHLPGYTADQLVPRLRVVTPRSRVVILTSDTSEMTLMRGVQAGIAGYLTKDKALEDVIDALRTVSQGGSMLTERQLATVEQLSQHAAGESLTTREIEILKLLARGRDTVAIAEELTISGNTVRTHVQNIFAKLGAHSKLEAVTIAKDRRILS